MGDRINNLAKFKIDDDMREWAVARGIIVDLDELYDRFVDWHLAHGKRSNDYAASFRNWARKEQRDRHGTAKPIKPSPLEAPLRGATSKLDPKVRLALVKEFGNGPVRAWLDGLEFKQSGGIWRAKAPSRFARDTINSKYLGGLKRALDGYVHIDVAGR